MRKERKHYTAEEKVAVLRRHLLGKVPVSDLCEELGLQPTVFYRFPRPIHKTTTTSILTLSALVKNEPPGCPPSASPLPPLAR